MKKVRLYPLSRKHYVILSWSHATRVFPGPEWTKLREACNEILEAQMRLSDPLGVIATVTSKSWTVEPVMNGADLLEQAP